MTQNAGLQKHMRAPVDLDSFRYAFAIASSVSEGKLTGPDPSEREFGIEDEETGGVDFYRFNDNPMMRMVGAISDQLQNVEHIERTKIIYRIFEFGSLIEDERFAEWIVRDTDSASVSDDLIDLMASVPLTSKGKFPVNSMLRTIKEAKS